MKNTIVLVLFYFLLVACSSQKKETVTDESAFELSNEIFLSEIIRELNDSIYLSEWVDSITYIPLETTTNNLIREFNFINITPEYVFSRNLCFNWDGSFLKRLGQLGQGPCEDHRPIYYSAFIDDHFYTKGGKLIEYDKNGVCTGKNKYLFNYSPKSSIQFVATGNIKRVNNNFITFQYPDSIYFINTDFDIVKSYPIMQWEKNIPAQRIGPDYRKYLTHYNDTILFYNYYTDTVYYATETSLIPKWIIKLNEQDKFSSDFIYNFDDYFTDNFRALQQGKVESSKVAKLMDHRIFVSSIHETDNFLFIFAEVMMFQRALRDLAPIEYYILRIDKNVGEISGTKKIIDDLGGMDTFIPFLGICNNIMVNAIWPYDLKDYINEKQLNNQKVDERLVKLARKVDVEDNPILILAHLKK